MLKLDQKVICINDDFSNVSDEGLRHCILPRFGITYTVREINTFGVLLNEIINPKFIWLKYNNARFEPYFHPARFVPVVEDEVEEAQYDKNFSTV